MIQVSFQCSFFCNSKEMALNLTFFYAQNYMVTTIFLVNICNVNMELNSHLIK